jgi:hypothetical protein
MDNRGRCPRKSLFRRRADASGKFHAAEIVDVTQPQVACEQSPVELSVKTCRYQLLARCGAADFGELRGKAEHPSGDALAAKEIDIRPESRIETIEVSAGEWLAESQLVIPDPVRAKGRAGCAASGGLFRSHPLHAAPGRA